MIYERRSVDALRETRTAIKPLSLTRPPTTFSTCGLWELYECEVRHGGEGRPFFNVSGQNQILQHEQVHVLRSKTSLSKGLTSIPLGFYIMAPAHIYVWSTPYKMDKSTRTCGTVSWMRPAFSDNQWIIKPPTRLPRSPVRKKNHAFQFFSWDEMFWGKFL